MTSSDLGTVLGFVGEACGVRSLAAKEGVSREIAAYFRIGEKERSNSQKTVPADIERTIGSVSWFRLFEVEEVHVAPGVAGKDQFERVGKCTA